MKHLLLLGLLLLYGCSAAPELVSTDATEDKIVQKYADVTVSRIIRVYDGDTFICDVDEISPIAGKNIRIRLKGIDTPELKDQDPAKRKAAEEERDRLAALLSQAGKIELRNIDRCKYFRILADVYIDGESLLPKLNSDYLLHRRGDK